MPTPGLSLVGFMDQPQAIQHLKFACVPAAGANDDAIIADWKAAQSAIGPPVANAGKPRILPLPDAQKAYAKTMLEQPWIARVFSAPEFSGAVIQLVEIDPLLPLQFTVDTVRCDHFSRKLANPATLDELMPICLPHAMPQLDIKIYPQIQSTLIKARGVDLRMVNAGLLNANTAGLMFGPVLPFVGVMRFNGRCYLNNGFHRAVAARMAGATHLPCVVRDIADRASAGIRDDGSTFTPNIFESNNAPTVGHFTQGRAHAVHLRAQSRVLHVTWAEYTVFNE